MARLSSQKASAEATACAAGPAEVGPAHPGPARPEARPAGTKGAQTSWIVLPVLQPAASRRRAEVVPRILSALLPKRIRMEARYAVRACKSARGVVAR